MEKTDYLDRENTWNIYGYFYYNKDRAIKPLYLFNIEEAMWRMKGATYGKFFYSQYSMKHSLYKPIYQMTREEVEWRLGVGGIHPEWKPTFEWWMSLTEEERELYRLMINLG